VALELFSRATRAAVSALLVHGTEEQKRRYIPKMLSGQWTGTMNLTEPHCGTDLGMMRTRATKQPDGSYGITGTKIFISGGEHDITENIVHLVLARIEGAPAGDRSKRHIGVPCGEGINRLVLPRAHAARDHPASAPDIRGRQEYYRRAN
jgi:alkylation response protein AidB-like acyl-CoA dehydrogenase